MFNHYIAEFRGFNRFYTAWIGILNRSFLHSKFSLPETRVLHTIYYQEGVTSTEIFTQLNMDKSYLSRILINFEKKKLITKKVSAEDGRVFNLYLTKSGRKDFESLDRASDKQVQQLLVQLSEKEREALIKSMTQIKETLSRYTLPDTVADD
jgi:DNA-binding MarR family transcriptional regulator